MLCPSLKFFNKFFSEYFFIFPQHPWKFGGFVLCFSEVRPFGMHVNPSPEYKALPPELHSLEASYWENLGFCPLHALMCTVSQWLDSLALLTILAYSWKWNQDILNSQYRVHHSAGNASCPTGWLRKKKSSVLWCSSICVLKMANWQWLIL